MRKRSRAYEAGSVEVGSVETRSSITKSIFFANRVDGAFVCNQIDAATASRSGKGRQSEPARTPRAARSSQARPDRVSQVAQPQSPSLGPLGSPAGRAIHLGRQIEPHDTKSSQPGAPCRSAATEGRIRSDREATSKARSGTSSSNFVIDTKSSQPVRPMSPGLSPS